MANRSSLSHVPGFRCWLRALTLWFLFFPPLAFVGYITGWGFLLLLTALKTTDWLTNNQLIQASIILGIAWVIVGGMFIPMFLMGHVHQFFWGEPDAKLPKWMPNRKSQIEAFRDWFVCVFTSFICGLIYLMVYSFKTYILDLPVQQPSPREEQMFIAALVIVSAHLYHFDKRIQAIENKIKSRTKHKH